MNLWYDGSQTLFAGFVQKSGIYIPKITNMDISMRNRWSIGGIPFSDKPMLVFRIRLWGVWPIICHMQLMRIGYNLDHDSFWYDFFALKRWWLDTDRLSRSSSSGGFQRFGHVIYIYTHEAVWTQLTFTEPHRKKAVEIRGPSRKLVTALSH